VLRHGIGQLRQLPLDASRVSIKGRPVNVYAPGTSIAMNRSGARTPIA
jgi:hypothetical protein